MRTARRLPVLLATAGALACTPQIGDHTYFRDVEPIVARSCQPCHVEGGVAPFPLTSYYDAESHVGEIVRAVQDRTMPPWLPSHAGVPLQGDPTLTDAEIATIVGWAETRARPGSRGDRTLVRPAVQIIRPDVELSAADPYTPALGSEERRCFVLDPALAAAGVVTGYAVLPGDSSEVADALLAVVADQGSALASLQALDDADPGPGWSCLGGIGLDLVPPPGGVAPARLVGSWTPGSGAVLLPAGTGIAVPAGARIVLQVHYDGRAGAAPDRTRVLLQLADGPVREAAIVPLARQDLLVPAGAASFLVEQDATATQLASQGVAAAAQFTIVGVFPEMLLRGRSLQLSVTRALGEELLLDVPRWDFRWKRSWTLAEPVPVAPGDTLTLRCTYDNSAANQPPGALQAAPQDLTWGESIQHEMCVAFAYVVY